MKIIGKPVVAFISIAIAAIVGAFAYNFKYKAAVASDHLDGLFGQLTRAAMEKDNYYGNICLFIAILFLGLTVASFVIYAKNKGQTNE